MKFAVLSSASKLVAFLLAVAVAIIAGTSVAKAQQAGNPDIRGGDLRAPSPVIVNWDRPGYFQVGVGPSFASGFDSNQAMYDLNLGYNYNFSNIFTGKAMTDFNFGSASSASRLVNLSLGIDAYFAELNSVLGIPYVGVDAGYGFARNDKEQTQDAATVGAGAGFKFMVEAVNLDVSLHYAVMTAPINGITPTVLALRLATSF